MRRFFKVNDPKLTRVDQAAIAYIKDARSVSRQQRQDPAVVTTEESRVYDIMRIGHPQSIASVS